MLVDDDETVRATLRRCLERRGWLVLEVATAESALQLLLDDAVQVDVVIVDMYLPGLSGSALCGEIRARRPALLPRLIVISGDVGGATLELGRADLRCPVLSKPFELDELDQLLDVAVAGG
jgi:two-component system cell cycle sensor histidine kinase/response regulator CckA